MTSRTRALFGTAHAQKVTSQTHSGTRSSSSTSVVLHAISTYRVDTSRSFDLLSVLRICRGQECALRLVEKLLGEARILINAHHDGIFINKSLAS